MKYKYERPSLWRQALFYVLVTLAWVFSTMSKATKILAKGLHNASNRCAVEAFFIARIPKTYK